MQDGEDEDNRENLEGVFAIASNGAEARKAAESLLAPRWHTALVVALAAAASVTGARSAHHLASRGASSNLPSYLASIALELVLLAVVLWGLHLRRTPWRLLLGERRPAFRDWLVDAGAALVFWIVALAVLGSIGVLLQQTHMHPEKIRTTVSKLAPYSASELMGWTALSFTAGICEEFIFRGYLQLQFARLGHRIWVGVFASALVFGFAHGYEGLSGMLLITAFGALFSVLRLVRGSLRAGMMAHAWHDFFSGLMLSLIAHQKLLPLVR